MHSNKSWPRSNPAMSYAGILPYAMVRGEPVLLLGREKKIPGWRGSGLWAPFGGGVEAGESLRAAALREGYEETMGMLGTPGQLSRGIHPAPWRHTGGATWLLPIPYHKQLSAYFRNFYLYSQHCHKTGCPTGWYEKTEIRWVPLRKVHSQHLRPEFRQTLPSLRQMFASMQRGGGIECAQTMQAVIRDLSYDVEEIHVVHVDQSQLHIYRFSRLLFVPMRYSCSMRYAPETQPRSVSILRLPGRNMRFI
jgi:8-oxo-dGTP pyrophosphatase MutT (NUDIX family)